MLEAARRQGRDVERVSFVDAMRWLAAPEGAGELPALVINPDRPGRVEPRVVKRRPKKFMWMTRTRAEWHKRLLAQAPHFPRTDDPQATSLITPSSRRRIFPDHGGGTSSR